MKMFYAVQIDLTDTMVVAFSEDEATVRQYVDFIDRHDLKVVKISSQVLNNLYNTGNVFIEKIDFSLNDDIMVSEGDGEYISQEVETFCDKMSHDLRYIKKKLKYFHGDKAKKLKKAIEEFEKDEYDNQCFSGVDEHDRCGKLMMKVKLAKISSKLLRLQYKN